MGKVGQSVGRLASGVLVVECLLIQVPCPIAVFVNELRRKMVIRSALPPPTVGASGGVMRLPSHWSRLLIAGLRRWVDDRAAEERAKLDMCFACMVGSYTQPSPAQQAKPTSQPDKAVVPSRPQLGLLIVHGKLPPPSFPGLGPHSARLNPLLRPATSTIIRHHPWDFIPYTSAVTPLRSCTTDSTLSPHSASRNHLALNKQRQPRPVPNNHNNNNNNKNNKNNKTSRPRISHPVLGPPPGSPP
ncbi:predicted protein [Plenodomus lingam JN3]|uniref:Predicted protein n=1 Tax=Leptosphaeria maculans (strain JN3 / isolate v23.1.3 / race Av1-4-5-6-7-8) TaxID=985895 RepID=E5ACY0_LEPMJ|nr:predicted protein [Plenodomus lingam JN3]CBY02332.1 predicted protein [Plenodomus lingam JN3]